MAKSVLEDLMGMLDPAERTAIQAKIASNPDLLNKDLTTVNLFNAYNGETQVDSTSLMTPHTPVVPNSTPAPVTPAATPATVVAAPAPGTSDSNAILSKLTELSTSIDTKLAELDKRYVPVTKLGEYRADILASSIKAADDYATVRETHRAEFGKPLDRDAFEKFVTDQTTAGVKFTNMKAAHDSFVQEERINLRVQNGIAEGVRTKTSAATVPGQTQSVAMSPALQVLAKQREGAKTGDRANAAAAAERLAAMVHARDNGGGAVN